MNQPKKIFAFKLAEKKEKAATTKWKARDGVSVAGCTDRLGTGDFRESSLLGGRDNAVFC